MCDRDGGSGGGSGAGGFVSDKVIQVSEEHLAMLEEIFMIRRPRGGKRFAELRKG